MARRNEYSRDRAPDKDDADGKLWRHWGDGGVGETISARLQGYDPSTPGYVDVQVDGDGVVQTAGGGGGGGTTIVEQVALSVRVDDVGGGIMYVGESVAGTASATAGWRIKKMTATGPDITLEWVASGAFTQVWNDRLGLTYN